LQRMRAQRHGSPPNAQHVERNRELVSEI
jgi:hypothetical protein